MCLDRGKTLTQIVTRVRPGVGYKYLEKSEDGRLYICMNMALEHGIWTACKNPKERIGSTMAGFHFFRSIPSALKARKYFRTDGGYFLHKIEYLHPVAFGKQYGASAGVAHMIRIIEEINLEDVS